MKTFKDYISEQKQTFIVHGQAGGKAVVHEVEAKSHEHAKAAFKKAMKEKGHKYPTTISVRTSEEEKKHRASAEAFAKDREEKIAKNTAERDKDKAYWDDRQKEYNRQGYKGE